MFFSEQVRRLDKVYKRFPRAALHKEDRER
jgi:hypothetical protein